eukprot:193146-Pleurochrysis_carterae.AAC.1
MMVEGRPRLRRATRSSTKMDGTGDLGGRGTLTVVDIRPVEAATHILMTSLGGGVHRPSATINAYKRDQGIFHMQENLTAEAGVLQVVARGGVVE